LKELIGRALLAREQAYAPYSNFPVGAALRGKSGKIYPGCNVESAAFGASICAERVALARAISEGEREFLQLAIVADLPKGPTPCGICRQALWEFGDLQIITANLAGDATVYTLGELLPHAFGDFRRGDGFENC
jgi:cytidine deaminase